MIDLPDDFEAHARSVLGSQDPVLLNKLLALRAEIHQYLLVPWPGETPSAETLNARNQHMLDQAAKLLGKDKFTHCLSGNILNRMSHL